MTQEAWVAQETQQQAREEEEGQSRPNNEWPAALFECWAPLQSSHQSTAHGPSHDIQDSEHEVRRDLVPDQETGYTSDEMLDVVQSHQESLHRAQLAA